MAAIRLPSWPCSCWPRIDTGTSARSSSPSTRVPRNRSQRRNAPVTTASTTSLTVPPSAFLISLYSSSRPCTQITRRCGPIGTFSGVSGAGFSPAQATSPTPSIASPAADRVWRGWVIARVAREAMPSGSLATLFAPSAISSACEGSGWGVQSSGSTCCGTGARSNSTEAMSTPETPSTSAWWVLLISAKRLSSSPCTSHSSQSGFERSSRWEKIRPASWRSCSVDPGAGSAVWRTWYSMLKVGSSIQSGRPISKRGVASFWR
jgi:hypothetical protein